MQVLRSNQAESEAHEPMPTARDIMTANPVSSSAEEYVMNAITTMSIAGIRHLPILDPCGRLVGMLSDRDIRLRSDEFIDTAFRMRDMPLRVAALMRTHVPTVKLEASLDELIAAFSEWRVDALSVVDDERRVKGIVSYIDVLCAMRERFLKTT